ncbi:MAG: hypothetical protein WD278_10295 [Pirellulales bacterium]
MKPGEPHPAKSDRPGGGAAGRPAVDFRRPHWAVLSSLVLLFIGYVVVFYACPLPSLKGQIRRFDFLTWAALLPDQAMSAWFGDPPQFMLRDRLGVLCGAAAILAVSAMVGRLLMRGLGLDRGLTRLEVGVFSAGVGLNTVSLYVLAVGLLGKLRISWFAVPAGLVLLAMMTWLIAEKLRPRRRPVQPEQPARRREWLSHRWLWMGAPFAVAIILGGMLPPVDFDVREYHLQAPKEFFQEGRIVFLPHNVYGNMALGSEMLSLLAMVLLDDWWFGALVGKTVIATVTPLTALALLAAGLRLFSLRAGVVAALVYISIPWISQVSSNGLVEGVSAFYLLLSVFAVLLSRVPAEGQPGEAWRRVLLAGYLAGAAVSCKYPGVLFVVVPLAAYLWLTGRKADWKPVALFLVATSAGCGLWFYKNWLLTGNPTYPLLYEVFGGATRTVEKNNQWLLAHMPPGYSMEQLADSLAKVFCTSEWLSPLVMPLAVMAWLARGQRRQVMFLWGFFAYVVAAWWVLTHRIDRFWIPALPVAALLAGVGASWSASLGWRRIVTAVLICGLMANLLFVVSGAGGYNAYFVQLEKLRNSPGRADPWHLMLNNIVPPGSGVLMVGDAQVFDLEVPVLYNTVFDESVFVQICQGRSAEEIRQALLDRQISHVYVHWGEIARYRRQGNYGFPTFVQPALFEQLVQHGVFDAPLQSAFHRGKVYPVRGEWQRAVLDQQPPLVPAKSVK